MLDKSLSKFLSSFLAPFIPSVVSVKRHTFDTFSPVNLLKAWITEFIISIIMFACDAIMFFAIPHAPAKSHVTIALAKETRLDKLSARFINNLDITSKLKRIMSARKENHHHRLSSRDNILLNALETLSTNHSVYSVIRSRLLTTSIHNQTTAHAIKAIGHHNKVRAEERAHVATVAIHAQALKAAIAEVTHAIIGQIDRAVASQAIHAANAVILSITKFAAVIRPLNTGVNAVPIFRASCVMLSCKLEKRHPSVSACTAISHCTPSKSHNESM